MNFKVTKEFREEFNKLCENLSANEASDLFMAILGILVLPKNPELTSLYQAFMIDEKLLEKMQDMPGLFEFKGDDFHVKISVFEDQEPVKPLDNSAEKTLDLWIKEFRDKFKEANPDRWGTLSTCKERMKKFLKKYPDVTSQEVLTATDLYLHNTDRRYVMKSHKFIFDGMGTALNSTLEEWIEKYRDTKETSKNLQNSNDVTEKMQ